MIGWFHLKQCLWAFNTPKAAPSGKEWICMFIQTNTKIKFSQVCAHNKWAGNMLMFHVEVNMKRLGIHFKGVVDWFFLGLIVFMGCSLTCVHASFFKNYFSHNLPLFHTTLSLLGPGFIPVLWSPSLDGLRLVSWLSVLWLAKPPSARLNVPPLASAACAPVEL